MTALQKRRHRSTKLTGAEVVAEGQLNATHLHHGKQTTGNETRTDHYKTAMKAESSVMSTWRPATSICEIRPVQEHTIALKLRSEVQVVGKNDWRRDELWT